MEPVIIPAQPGWGAKRKNGTQYQPVIAWVIYSGDEIGDGIRAIGAISGKLDDFMWILEYNPRPKAWNDS
jgi:hypothetical protein